MAHCSSYMFAFFAVIREKLEIIFHQTLAPNVENICKDTYNFHKKPKHLNTYYT